MASSKPDGRPGRLFRDPSGQDELFEKSYEEEREAKRGAPVECLGQTFENDEARRSHFLGRLREGLEELQAKLGGVSYEGVDEAVARMGAIEHWPMGADARLRGLAVRMRHADPSKDLLQRWKDEVGFPHGEIDDILSLSDPPWHTACPNPFLGAFVEAYGKPYDPDDAYRRKPFAVDVSEGKTHAVYRGARIPHQGAASGDRAVNPPLHPARRSGAGRFRRLGHDRSRGPMVRDGAGELPEAAGSGVDRGRVRTSRAGGGGVRFRSDLSPLAGFIAANYGLPFDVDAFAEAGMALLDEVEAELGWMYETLHTDGETKARIDYTVWSEVFACPECASEIVFTEEALDETSGRVRDMFPCPHCGSELTRRRVERIYTSRFDPAINATIQVPKRKPAAVVYSLGRKTYQKKPDAADLSVHERIDRLSLPPEVPSDAIPPMHMTHQRARMDLAGVTHIHHFFLPRAAHALSAMWRRASAHSDPRVRHMLLYFVEQAIWTMSILNRYRPTGYSQVNQYLAGVYYVPSQISECSPWYVLGGKRQRLGTTFHELRPGR